MDFKQILDWCLNHYQILIPSILSLINILILICKKKVKITDSLLSEVLTIIPLYIKEAEDVVGAGNGQNKFSYVFNKCINLIRVSNGMDNETAIRSYGDIIIRTIENIMACPQKKTID